MAHHDLIDDHLTDLGRHLPAGVVEELADGLLETWQCHLDDGLAPADAARAAIAEFGTPEDIVKAFVAQAPGRRIARMLLATGPLVGLCWAVALLAGHVWTWQVPAATATGFGVALLAAVAVLVGAATSRHSYRRTRLGTAGGLGLLVLDAAMLSAVLVLAPAAAWPMFAAIAASVARIGLTLRVLPSLVGWAAWRAL